MKFRASNLFYLSRVIEHDIVATEGTWTRLLRIAQRSYSDGAGAAESAPSAAAAAAEPLTDRLGRRHNYLRISLTERCNLRCQYCMPAEGVPLSRREALLSREELARLVRVFAAAGVDKLRLTGGEPTVRSDLADIIQMLKSISGVRVVSMTTNGVVLTRRLPALQRAGLDALNVSLDTLRADRYERMARRPGLARVLAGVELALQLGYRPVKLNTVLVKDFNDDEICDFVEYTRDRDIEVRFIEFMPFAGNKWDDSKLIPYRAALRAVLQRYPDLAPTLPRPNDTARVWRVPGYAGSVGFIASMTQHFCGSCNRLRLTADGNLKVCLFGAAEVSLRDAARAGAGDARLDELVRAALRNKQPQHAARRAATGRRAAGARAYSTSAGAGAGAGACSGAEVEVEVEGEEEEAEAGAGALTHVDASGRARMVDVGHKPVTRRVALAQCSLEVGGRVLRLLRDAQLPKGDALTVAQVAGVLGAKRAADLLPLCHPLALECVRVRVRMPRGGGGGGGGGGIEVTCEARVTARTGAEMEALAGAAVAALALYDMCKAVDKRMRITDLRLVHKSGGSGSGSGSGGGRARAGSPPPPPPPPRSPDRSPSRTDETYAPTNFMHF